MRVGVEKPKYSASNSMIAGSLAGLVARAISAPLDVVKIRFQLQSLTAPRYISILDAFRTIYRDEGIFSLWKGNLCATYLWVIYGATQFVVYDSLKMKIFEQLSSPTSHFSAFVMGGVAASVATAVSYPMDVMRTQYIMQGRNAKHTSLVRVSTQLLRRQGTSGFYSGLPIAVMAVAPSTGATFMLYEFLSPFVARCCNIIGTKTSNVHCTSQLILKTMGDSFAGGVAGGTAKLLVYPLDVIKRYHQIRVLDGENIFAGGVADGIRVLKNDHNLSFIRFSVDLVRDMWREGGIRGFYKGISPSLCKSMVSTASMFATFEAVKLVLPQ